MYHAMHHTTHHTLHIVQCHVIPYAIPSRHTYRLSDASVSIGVVDFASQATVISALSTDAAAVSRPPAFIS